MESQQSQQESKIIEMILNAFAARGNEKYADEGVTQQQHALQTASYALSEGATESMVVAALLHDLGHILSKRQLPESCEEDLDDKHESIGYAILTRSFDRAVTDPIRLHVAAKRYLCTVEPDYKDKLSPTSLKSFYDQGGNMNDNERNVFELEPHFDAAVKLRRWDDLAKDPHAQTHPIDFFVPLLQQALVSGS